MTKYIILFLCCFLSYPAHATTWFADQSLVSSCANTTGQYYNEAARDCTGADSSKKGYNSLYTPNASAVAGDTIYIRGDGSNIYTVEQVGSTTKPGIQPSNSGTDASTRITYSIYAGDTLTVKGSYYNSRAISLTSKDWIYVTGIDFDEFYRFLYLSGSNHNEIGNCTFTDFASPAVGGSSLAPNPNGGSYIGDTSTYNYIHDCTFRNYSGMTTTYDGSYPFMIGDVFVNASDGYVTVDFSYYNVVENCTFSQGGHAVAAVSTRYNVLRGNTFRHEIWNEIPASSGDYWGYHALQISGPYDGAGYNLVEGNIAAFASENPLTTNWGGHGLKLCAQDNIIRYNDFIGNWLAGIGIRAYGTREGQAYRNYPYENYIYNNTFSENSRHPIDFQGHSNPSTNLLHAVVFTILYDTGNSAGTTPPSYSSEGYDTIYDNVLKNNLISTSNCNNSPYSSSIYTYDSQKLRTWFNSTYGYYCDDDPEGTHPCLAHQTISNNLDVCLGDDNPLFESDTLSDASSTTQTLPDLALTVGSPAEDTGTYLTQVNNANGTGTSFVVDDAKYFQDGKFGSASGCDPAQWPSTVTMAGDFIIVGATVATGDTVQITGINYTTKTLTVTPSFTWADDDKVWLYKDSDGTIVLYGSGTDYGSHERQPDEATPFTVTVSKTGEGSGTITSDDGYFNCGTTCQDTTHYTTAASLDPTFSFVPSGSDRLCEAYLDGVAQGLSGTAGETKTMQVSDIIAEHSIVGEFCKSATNSTASFSTSAPTQTFSASGSTWKAN